MMETAPDLSHSVILADETDTQAFGEWFAARLQPGDVLLLEGPIGAGKTFFARAVIQTILARTDQSEDVPSPTYTLVQVYEAGKFEIWHADLYRLTGSDEVMELGLDEAFETALCLLEWPDRLGALRPRNALTLRFQTDAGGGRQVVLQAQDPRWADVMTKVSGWRDE